MLGVRISKANLGSVISRIERLLYMSVRWRLQVSLTLNSPKSTEGTELDRVCNFIVEFITHHNQGEKDKSEGVLAADEKVIDIACGTLHTLVKTGTKTRLV